MLNLNNLYDNGVVFPYLGERLHHHVPHQTETIEVPVKGTIQKYELKMHTHLQGKIILGVRTFSEETMETSPMGSKVVSDTFLKNTYLTLANQLSREPFNNIPLKALDIPALDNNNWAEYFLPYSDIGKSHVKLNQPPALPPLGTPGNETVDGTIEQAAKEERVFVFEFSYVVPIDNCPPEWSYQSGVSIMMGVPGTAKMIGLG